MEKSVAYGNKFGGVDAAEKVEGHAVYAQENNASQDDFGVTAVHNPVERLEHRVGGNAGYN